MAGELGYGIRLLTPGVGGRQDMTHTIVEVVMVVIDNIQRSNPGAREFYCSVPADSACADEQKPGLLQTPQLARP